MCERVRARAGGGGGSYSHSSVFRPVSVSLGFVSGAQVRTWLFFFKSIYNFPVAILGSA